MSELVSIVLAVVAIVMCVSTIRWFHSRAALALRSVWESELEDAYDEGYRRGQLDAEDDLAECPTCKTYGRSPCQACERQRNDLQPSEGATHDGQR